MELSIVHNIDLVKALNELKAFNTYHPANNRILLFSVDTGEKRWILPGIATDTVHLWPIL